MAEGLTGCLPGTFNPPTIAHLGMAETAIRQAGLARVDWVVSTTSLGKEDVSLPSVAERIGVLEQVAASRPWLGVVRTDLQLIADIAEGYDAVILGADKWRQVIDPAWYDSPAERDRAVARLPRVLVSPRLGERPEGVEILEIEHLHTMVSSTAIRQGSADAAGWLLPEAASSGLWPSS